MNPIKLMGPTSYARMVEHLRSLDRIIASFSAQHQTAVDQKDETAAAKYAQAVERLKERRSEYEDRMRRAEPNVRNNFPTT